MSAEKIKQLQSQILDKEKKQLRLERLLNLAKRWRVGPYEPTVADVETWEEYGRYGAMTAWQQQGGGFSGKEDENGDYYIDKKTAIKEHEEFEDFCKEYVFELTKEDWLHFYQMLIDNLNHSIKSMEIQSKEINFAPKSERKSIQSRPGRKMDHEAASQKYIEKEVKKLVEKGGRFTKKDGTPKPTTIRDELIKHSKISLGERQLFDRVKKALQ